MATETDFSFKTLTDRARRHIRVFQIHQFLDRFAMGLTVAVVALALTDRGMDLFQISLLFGVYSLTTMAMELPFGGLADNIGRKPVFLAAVLASLVSLALFLSSSDFGVLALSFAFIGFGRALRSGTLDAWFVETFKAAAPNVDVQPALAKAQWANAMGLAVGAVLGGLLPDMLGAIGLRHGISIYDVSYAASFIVMVGVLVYTMFAIAEDPRPLNRNALRQGFASVPSVIAEASLLALKHPTLSKLLAALALFLMATNPVEVIWPTYAKPMLDEDYANTVIGVLTAGYFFAIAFGASLSPHISRIFKRRHAVTLAAVFACLAVVQVTLAMQGGIAGFVGVFLLYSVLLGASETPASSILHRCVEDRQRSTMLSLRSLIQQLGGAIGLVMAGALAEIYSTPVAWSAGAVFLLTALALSLVLAKRLAAEAK
ncbi:MFS transporter [Roseobacter sp. HKCCD9010]|uniref:MFS transporter n=1 Tax=unclassified Roseobacter TaxID=196798 RepID=UPI00149208DF|nr:MULTISPECIES: MFS transporter [unclassified Roseobacter]MBF9049157.1 MFS transporter [Rhodobacterales bacterium HKCCD4356]NNV11157.1 MFS transporter [Roseobacter sp. HKCCD7357]NNV15341.1 MFS transporter [Roseobacter sp. HKCCD8768]NNV24801.1 MFS transporter [Roseobacter sp. HKCCD8192]NNV29057.1 MFS transporter [Roseobacter sp. HKCCD9061]